ncbi:MAG: PHP domain-containing protein [Spirochaetaceae bacterium]|jgi:predicted metal-dependent phosphoesterase TrpH|nr:PHP domain-containing protein [Spirochaetaceae bacterium]
MVDLHTHSSASDGSLSPARLLERASQVGIKLLALTDHDTFAGLDEGKKAAESLGIRFIPGVELEIQTEKPETGATPVLNPENSRPLGEDAAGKEEPPAGKGGSAFAQEDTPAGTGGSAAVQADTPAIKGEFHLLGLGINRITAEFRSTLAWLGGARERRNLAMVEKMRAAGIEADYEAVKAFAGGDLVGRPHFGLFLVSKGVVKNQDQAFKRWLGKGRPFYVPREGLAFTKALGLIHQAGGIALLAHPLSLYVSWGRLPDLLARLKEQGLDGIEAWHPNAGIGACKRLEELGRRLGLRISAGSDFHGSARPDRRLGHTAGNQRIDDRFLEALQGLI